MTSLYRFFERLHQRPLPAWVRLFLPLSWGYGLGVAARLQLYRWGWSPITKVSVPVISIGNLTTGGTGKTPVVIALAQLLQTHGKRVVILSRGYGAATQQAYARAIHPAFGDEAALMQEQVPDAVVIVGRDRAANAQRAITEHQPDVILLDDGFQHLRLHRDFNLLLVDGALGLGNGHLLPLGPLREPVAECQRAHAIVLTKAIDPRVRDHLDLVQCASRQKNPYQHTINNIEINGLPLLELPFDVAGLYTPQAQHFPSQVAWLSMAQLQQKPQYVCCGIARPDSLLTSLATLNLAPKDIRMFPDHHRYQPRDVPAGWQQDANAVLITTEKDWVKLKTIIPPDLHPRVALVKLQPRLDPEQWWSLFAPLFDSTATIQGLRSTSNTND